MDVSYQTLSTERKSANSALNTYVERLTSNFYGTSKSSSNVVLVSSIYIVNIFGGICRHTARWYVRHINYSEKRLEFESQA